MAKSCTKIPVHQHAPYGGSFVYTTFSGSHQDMLDLPRGLQVTFSNDVQRHTEELRRELLAIEITDLFKTSYFLHENLRFSLIDYSIIPDRSRSPLPSAVGKTQDTKSLIRIFDGVFISWSRV
ncbi:hypothetical protein EDB81DRAFT_878051 [Dactylonectria macrodidyma]|uniref:Uncharacterized protein n=1 Tax=Dactylonectria macrodidyma TaxID=307937 RepID=A0A9P9JMK7_9HYPO|nr:hypothetical protein EDB81DRAFT_878051 [Dactylonectria macrodidyma]